MEDLNNREENSMPNQTPKGGGKSSVWKSPVLWIAIVILLGAGAVAALAYTGTIDISKYMPTSGPVSENTVATVNGEAIKKGELDERVAQQQQVLANQNQNLNEEQLNQLRKQMLQNLINETLILQKAAEADIAPTDQEVTQQFNQIASQYENEAAFNEQLSEAGITESDLRETIRRQLTSQAYLRENIDLSQASTTDAEVQEAYDNLAQQQGENSQLPSFEQLSGQLRQQLQNQKVNQLVSAFVTQLREGANIETFLNTNTNEGTQDGADSTE